MDGLISSLREQHREFLKEKVRNGCDVKGLILHVFKFQAAKLICFEVLKNLVSATLEATGESFCVFS